MSRSMPEINARYLLERSLGEQPVGRFFVAVDRELGGRVTLFLPTLGEVQPGDFVAELQPELERCVPLRDTPYCTLRDVGLTGAGQAFVVVDRPRGTPLSALLQESGRLATARALNIAIQLCDLVHRAHVQGIHPVPITPDSIIVDSASGGADRASVVDLAIHRGAMGRALNSPVHADRFSAPQVRAGHTVDPRDDVFAVTAVLHAMVFGVAPPEMSVFGPADGSGWPSLPGGGLDRRLEACLHTVMLRGLAPLREERFPRIGELQRALTGLEQLRSLSAPAFELLAATRGRLGRGTDVLDVSTPRPGLSRAKAARARIREVMTASIDGGANLSDLDEGGEPKLHLVKG